MNSIPKPNYVDKLEKSNAINNDIISTIHKNYNTAVFQTKNIAKSLKGNSDYETAKNVWLFLKRSLKYKRDPEGKQMIKLPSRLLANNERIADCKSYSLLAASLLANNGLKPTFRYASYKDYEKTPTHVYVTTKDSNGNEIIVDGCYKRFNDQKEFKYKYDYPMEVYTLSGVNGPLKKIVKKIAPKIAPKVAAKVVKVAAKVAPKATVKVAPKVAAKVAPKVVAKVAAKKVVKQEKKAVKQEKKAVKKVEKAEKKVAKKAEKAENKQKPLLQRAAQGVKKVAVAVPRTAFLGLVRLNVKSLATDLADANTKNPDKVKSFWTKLGGSYTELMSVVNHGKGLKPPLGVNGIGEPVTLATVGTALVTAAPIIIATASLLKQVGVKSNVIEKVAQQAAQAYENKTGESAAEVAKDAIDETSGEKASAGEMVKSLFTPKKLLLAGGAVAAFLILPKLFKSKK